MKIKPLLPGIGVYIATSDDGLRKLGVIRHRPHADAERPWQAEKCGFISGSMNQTRLRTLNEARAWMRS